MNTHEFACAYQREKKWSVVYAGTFTLSKIKRKANFFVVTSTGVLVYYLSWLAMHAESWMMCLVRKPHTKNSSCTIKLYIQSLIIIIAKVL